MRRSLRRRALGAVVVTLALVAAAGCSSQTTSGSGEATSFTMAVQPTGTGLDPWKNVISQYASQASYDTLTHMDENGDATPWLATDWDFTDSTTLTMDLRDDVTFSDGTPFDADAVKANFDYAATATPANQAAVSTITNIASVEVVDDDTVVFHLVSADPDLPYSLATNSPMVSPAALADPDSLSTTPVGSGPYILQADQTTANDTYTYTKNPDYWAGDDWDTFDTLVIRVIGDQTASDNAALAGEIDYEIATSGTNVPGWNTSVGSANALQGLTIYDLTGAVSAPLADIRVRQAMNYAIDRQTILDEVYNGVGTVSASTPFSPEGLGWSDDLLDIYPYDPDKAKELLAEAGYPDGFTLQVLTNSQFADAAQAIAGYLRDVGIDVELSVHDTDLVEQVNSGTWAAAMSLRSVTGKPYTDVSSTMTLNSSQNPLHSDDPQIDEYLAEAAAATDDTQQDSIYNELATYAAEQAWFVTPVLTSQLHAYNPEVVSVVEPAGFGAPNLYQLTPAG